MSWIKHGVLAVVLSSATLEADDKARSFVFKKEDLGRVPSGWTADKTGKGDGSVWKLVDDATAPSKTGVALAQTAEGPSALFNLCVANDTNYKDVTISVAFKAMRGKLDQGGGVVWRYQDANNYYVARMNPLEDNYRVYKVINGKRIQLETEEDVKAPVGTWHILKIIHKGDQIECYLDDKKVLQAKDNTIEKAGKVGLWTKADAQTHFDSFTVSGN